MTDEDLYNAALELARDLEAALSAVVSDTLGHSLGEIAFLRIPADPPHSHPRRTPVGPAAAETARAHPATSAAERIAQARERYGAAPTPPSARP